MDRDARFLLDMLQAAERILERIAGRTRADLDSDLSLQETVYWQIAVLGEAANHLSETFREAHSDTPWHQIVGIRNRLIHGYRDIDNDVVWNVIRLQLPGLATFLAQLVTSGDMEAT